ncbi:Zinc finger and BTB domain containing 24 [Mactra antiquata]
MISEALKDIPGYKPILKAVLRQQIQVLVEQLSEQTGEETVVLSANISEGTLSHLGSEYGKVFLEEEQAIKSKFLGFCLKRNLNKTSELSQNTPGKSRVESSISQLKRKALPPDGLTPSSKVPRICEENTNNSFLSETNLMKHLPDLSRANSNYVQKLNQTVGQEVMKDSNFDFYGNFPPELNINTVAEPDIQKNDSNIDMSIVKVEKQSELADGENCRPADSNINKFDMSPNIPQYGYTSMWNKTFPAVGTNSQDSTNPSNNTMNSFTHGQFPTDWPDANTNNNQLPPRKEYKCEFCDKVFREKTNLRVHVRTHTGEKPFKCFLCGKEFAHSSNMKQHERGVHKLPPTVPQYKQQFYTGLSKMYEIAKQSENHVSENQMQSYQNMSNCHISSPNTNLHHRNEEKEFLGRESQAVFPTNGDNGFIDRIKSEPADETDDLEDFSNQCKDENSNTNSINGGNDDIENKSENDDLL